MSKGMIVAVVGKKRSGKDTIATMFMDGTKNSDNPFQQASFAQPMKKWGSAMLGIPQQELEDLKNDETKTLGGLPQTGRGFLQELGQGLKELLHDDMVWTNILVSNLEPTKRYVISDTRFPFEEEALRSFATANDMDYASIRVNRLEADKVSDNHVSEQMIDYIRATDVVENNGTLSELALKLQKLFPFLGDDNAI